MNNAESSISEPLGFKIFWGSMLPTLLVKVVPSAWAKLALSVMKVCLAVALCGNGFDGGGGGKLFPTEFEKLCVPLKKSWLRPWTGTQEKRGQEPRRKRGRNPGKKGAGTQEKRGQELWRKGGRDSGEKKVRTKEKGDRNPGEKWAETQEKRA